MKKQTPRDRGSSSSTKKPDRAAIAARDPGPGAINRPGFDLGGAVGDAKPKKRPSKSGARGGKR